MPVNGLPADHLTAFMYLLMRDHLPTGDVKNLVERAAGLAEQVQFSAPELQALAARYAAPLRVAEDPPAGDVPPGEMPPEGAVVAIEGHGDFGTGVPSFFRGGGGEPLSKEMIEFIERFDERISSTPEFAAAVNEAADAEMFLNENTARVIADRVRELQAVKEG